VKSKNGAFEITVDGVLKFSKLKEGRFPTDDETRQVVKA
jgi:selT/selW/selH-like putative selenoprotein